MIVSMTGYGNYEFENDRISFSMELKSVNSKYFESNIKLPYLFSNQEQKIVNVLKRELVRGRVSFNLSYKMKNSKDLAYSLDESKLLSYLDILNKIKKDANIDDKVSLENILNFQDIVSVNKKIDDKNIIDFLYSGLSKVIVEHKAFRNKEGVFLQKDILVSVSRVKKNINEINDIWIDKKDTYLERYKQKIAKISENYQLNNDRLFQEVAIIFDKRDINEELVRIESHIDSFLFYVENHDILGKRLTFLIQELFRESNTIASKSEVVEINKIVIDIKSELEKIKEQVQNIL
jgi:uncharacterized protein (TIGR00255 family)